MPRADAIIEQLGLKPHPERGYFRQTYRAALELHSGAHDGARAASTAIYFLITEDEPVTYLHRLKSDEIFHRYDGGPLDILRLFPDGSWDVARLGIDLHAGERPQIVIPEGTWFGTSLVDGASHCLVGCTVAPGFEYADFELIGDGRDLAARYPNAADWIRRMSRAT